MSGLGLVLSNLYGDIDRNIIILCPLRYIFEASVHFKVGRSSSRLCLVEKTMTGNVNFLTQNVGSETSLLDKNVDIDRNIIILCPLRYIFEASVHFKVGRSSSRLS